MWTRDTAAPNAPTNANINTNAHTYTPAPPTPAPASPARTEERRVIAWVGKSVLFRGDLIGLEDMSIDGRVEGTIELREHSLTIGPDANIQADITAKTVTVHGHVVGTITASDAVHIGATGSVEGDVTSRRLAMADGAVVRGKVATGTPRESRAEAADAKAVSRS